MTGTVKWLATLPLLLALAVALLGGGRKDLTWHPGDTDPLPPAERPAPRVPVGTVVFGTGAAFFPVATSAGSSTAFTITTAPTAAAFNAAMCPAQACHGGQQ